MATSIRPASIARDVAGLMKASRRTTAAVGATQMPTWTSDRFVVASTPATTYQLTSIPYGINVLARTATGGTTSAVFAEGTDYTVDYSTGIVTVSATLAASDVIYVSYVTTDDLTALSGPSITGTITDTFNRADSTTTLGTTSDGLATWTAVQGTWGISSNTAYCPHVNGSGSVPAFAVIDTAQADGAVQGTLGGSGAWDFGLVFRYADPNNYWAMTWLNGTNLSRVIRRVAGTGTVMATFTAVAGDVLNASFSGSALTFYKNGTSFYAPTDMANQTNTQHGMFALASNVGTLDDWSFTA